MAEKRIVLGAEDFSALVSGKVVEQDGVKIILSDIGFDEMLRSISKAWRANDKEKETEV